jgi:hypothetical protein
MDSRRFDALTKTLAHTGTRRGIVRLLTTLPLGVTLTTLLGERPDATAEDDDHRSSHRHRRRKTRNARRSGDDKDNRKGRRKGKDRSTPAPLSPPAPGCTPTTCAAQGKNCGSIADGCGGTLTCGTNAGACPLVGQPCVDNVCGSCVADCTGRACGADDDCSGRCLAESCPPGQSCINPGTCAYSCDTTIPHSCFGCTGTCIPVFGGPNGACVTSPAACAPGPSCASCAEGTVCISGSSSCPGKRQCANPGTCP